MVLPLPNQDPLAPPPADADDPEAVARDWEARGRTDAPTIPPIAAGLPADERDLAPADLAARHHALHQARLTYRRLTERAAHGDPEAIRDRSRARRVLALLLAFDVEQRRAVRAEDLAARLGDQLREAERELAVAEEATGALRRRLDSILGAIRLGLEAVGK